MERAAQQFLGYALGAAARRDAAPGSADAEGYGEDYRREANRDDHGKDQRPEIFTDGHFDTPYIGVPAV
jgi:hypothetical protein